MFLVVNKEKISAYIISVLTVCFLFFIANNATKNEMGNTTATSVNVENLNNYNMNNTKNVGNNICNNIFNTK